MACGLGRFSVLFVKRYICPAPPETFTYHLCTYPAPGCTVGSSRQTSNQSSPQRDNHHKGKDQGANDAIAPRLFPFPPGHFPNQALQIGAHYTSTKMVHPFPVLWTHRQS